MSFVKVNDLSRCNFPLIGLRLEKYSYNEVIMQDLSFLGKLKHHKDFSLMTNISMGNRIYQKKLVQKYFSQEKIKLYIFQIIDAQEFPPAALGDP